MATTTETAIERLDALRAAERDAIRRREQVASESRMPERKVRAVEARLSEVYAAAERSGVEPEPDRVAALTAELAAVRAEAQVEAAAHRGRVEGATANAEAASSALVRFAREHRAELVAELTPRAYEDRDELDAAVDRLRRLRWAETAGLAAYLCSLWGEAPTVPPNPLAGDVSTELDRIFAPYASGQLRDPRRFVPMPTAWLPEERE